MVEKLQRGKKSQEHIGDYPTDSLYEKSVGTHEHTSATETKTEHAHSVAEATKSAIDQAQPQDSFHDKRERSPAEKRRGAPSKARRDASFRSTMKEIREDMDTSEKTTSAIIHQPFIERTSEVLGSTIARPNALLSGSITAFIGITVLYFVAKNYGYQLSGFETIAAFAAGWLIGLLYDLLRNLLKR